MKFILNLLILLYIINFQYKNKDNLKINEPAKPAKSTVWNERFTPFVQQDELPKATFKLLGNPQNFTEVQKLMDIPETQFQFYNAIASKPTDDNGVSPKSETYQYFNQSMRKRIINYQPNYQHFCQHPLIMDYNWKQDYDQEKVEPKNKTNQEALSSQCENIFSSAKIFIQDVWIEMRGSRRKGMMEKQLHLQNTIFDPQPLDDESRAYKNLHYDFPMTFYDKGQDPKGYNNFMKQCWTQKDRKVKLNPMYAVKCLKKECIFKCTKEMPDDEANRKCTLKTTYKKTLETVSMDKLKEEEAFCNVICANPQEFIYKKILPLNQGVSAIKNESLSMDQWDGVTEGCKNTDALWSSCLNYGPILLKKVLLYYAGFTEIEIKSFLFKYASGRYMHLNAYQRSLLIPARIPETTPSAYWVNTILSIAYKKNIKNRKPIQDRCHFMKNTLLDEYFLKNLANTKSYYTQLKQTCNTFCKVTNDEDTPTGKAEPSIFGKQCQLRKNVIKDDPNLTGEPKEASNDKLNQFNLFCTGVCPALPDDFGNYRRVVPRDSNMGCCKSPNNECHCCASIGAPNQPRTTCIDKLDQLANMMIFIGKKVNNCVVNSAAPNCSTIFNAENLIADKNPENIEEEKLKFLDFYDDAVLRIKEMIKSVDVEKFKKNNQVTTLDVVNEDKPSPTK